MIRTGDPRRGLRPGMRRAGQVATEGEAEDKVKHIVTVSFDKVGRSGTIRRSQFRKKILGETGRSGKQYLSSVLWYQHVC